MKKAIRNSDLQDHTDEMNHKMTLCRSISGPEPKIKPVISVNTLVRHKKLKSLNIGCVSKLMKSTVMVNWGLDDCSKHKPEELEVVDTSKCKTVTMHEFASRILNDKSCLDDVIIGNEVKHYVGIGWVSHGVVTEADLKKYPRVVE